MGGSIIDNAIDCCGEILYNFNNPLYDVAEHNKERVQIIVVNNGYPDFIPRECIVAEFDPDQRNGLPQGLVDDEV